MGGRKILGAVNTNPHLARMANDIGNFFRSQRREDAVAGIENHLRSFWTPRMREKLTALLASGDAGLDELPAEALCRINNKKDKSPSNRPGATPDSSRTTRDCQSASIAHQILASPAN